MRFSLLLLCCACFSPVGEVYCDSQRACDLGFHCVQGHCMPGEAAAVVVFFLGDQRIFMLAIDDTLPKRSDQMQEPRGLDDGPTGRLELLVGLVCHNSHSSPGHQFGIRLISSIAAVL